MFNDDFYYYFSDLKFNSSREKFHDNFPGSNRFYITTCKQQITTPATRTTKQTFIAATRNDANKKGNLELLSSVYNVWTLNISLVIYYTKHMRSSYNGFRIEIGTTLI